MGYTEREVFEMTPRKYFLIYGQFLELSGVKKRTVNQGIDELP